MWTKSYTGEEIAQLEKRFRTALVNTSSGIRTAFLAITQGPRGLNTAVLTNVTHVGAHPAQMSVLFRPDNGQRHTLDNYRDTGSLTLVALPYAEAERVHGTSASFPEDQCEWMALGGELVPVDGWAHPLPSHALWAVELQWLEHFELSNGCLYTVGTVQNLGFGSETLPDENGIVRSPGSLVAQGLMSYFTVAQGTSFPYARVPQAENE